MLSRRNFLASTVAASAVAVARRGKAAVGGETPLLKVGIVSDVQGYDYPEDWGMSNFDKALRVLAKLEPDVLVSAGDLSDHGEDDTALRYYVALMKKRFGAKYPVQVACAGNHDVWTKDEKVRPQQQCIDEFCAAFGEKSSRLWHKVVKGFDFIALSLFEPNGFDAPSIALLKAALDKAVARDAKRPIFVVTHYHPYGTCIDSNCNAWKPLRELLNGYPQVVSLSGHTHCPLEDERSIWQGEFTAIETAGLSYGCMPVEYQNEVSCLIPYGREAIGFNFLEIYADRMVFRRYHADDMKPMKPGRDWVVKYPYKPSDAVYTEAKRKAAEVAPAFAAGETLLFRYDFGFVYFICEPAKHPDFVHHYELAITPLAADGAVAGETKTWKYLADFYRREALKNQRLCLKAPPKSMKPGGRYRCELRPVANFGTKGVPIALDVTVRASYTFNDMRDTYPQE